MRCTNVVEGKTCNADLPAAAHFCSGCGRKVAAMHNVVCPCGTTLTNEHKFCFTCGQAAHFLGLPSKKSNLSTIDHDTVVDSTDKGKSTPDQKAPNASQTAVGALHTKQHDPLDPSPGQGPQIPDASSPEDPNNPTCLLPEDQQSSDDSFSPKPAVAANASSELAVQDNVAKESAPSIDEILGKSYPVIPCIPVTTRFPKGEEESNQQGRRSPTSYNRGPREIYPVLPPISASSVNEHTEKSSVLIETSINTKPLHTDTKEEEKNTRDDSGNGHGSPLLSLDSAATSINKHNEGGSVPIKSIINTKPSHTDTKEEKDNTTDESGKSHHPPLQPSDSADDPLNASDITGGTNTPEEMKKKPTQTNSDNQMLNLPKKGDSSVLKTGEQEVAVVFHVIISTHFKVDARHDSVYLRFGHTALGGFEPDADEHRLKYIRNTELGLLYEGRVVMTTEVRNGGFPYKYVVARRAAKPKVVWEYVMSKQNREPGKRNQKQTEVNRQLFRINESNLQLRGDWHIYDGVAYPESFTDSKLKSAGKMVMQTLGSGIQTAEDTFRKEAVLSGKAFLPSPEKIQEALIYPFSKKGKKNTAEDYLDTVKSVMSSLRLQMLDISLERYDPKRTQTCIHKTLITPLLRSLEAALHNEPVCQTVTLALFVWLLKEEFNVQIKPEDVNLLCRSMLLAQDLANRVCPELNILKIQFPIRMENRSLDRAVVNLVDESGAELPHSDPSWWCCLPLLHFLDGSSVPFEEPQAPVIVQGGEVKDNFCTKRNNIFKQNVHTSSSKLTYTVKLLGPSFSADPLLFHSVVASLNLVPLLSVILEITVPVDLVAVTLTHHISRERHLTTPTKENLESVLEDMCSKLILSKESHRESLDLNEVRAQAESVRGLLCRVFDKWDVEQFETSLILRVVQLLFLALDCCAVVEEKIAEGPVSFTCLSMSRDVVEQICDQLCWTYSLQLKKKKEQDKLPELLQVWEQLYRKTEDLTNVTLKHYLESLITLRFEAEINKLTRNAKYKVYLSQFDKENHAFAAILNRLAFESLEEAFKEWSESGHDVRLVSLLSNFLEKKWREDRLTKDMLTFIVTWDPMVNYLQRFNHKKSMGRMDNAAKNILEDAVNCLNDTLQLLKDGKIPVCTLKFILSQRERFTDVMVALGQNKEKIGVALDLRGRELDAYELAVFRLDSLLEHCPDFLKTGDFEEIRSSVEQQRKNTDGCELNEVVEIAKLDKVDRLKTYTPKSNPWKVPDEILAILSDFEQNIKFDMFRYVFHSASERMDSQGAHFWRALLGLWQDVKREWEAVRDGMTGGTISLSDAEKVFGVFKTQHLRDYNFSAMEADLRKMSGNGATDWVDERVLQFSNYVKMNQHITAAKALLGVKRAHNIEGSFEDIEKICSLSTSSSLPIRDLDKSLLGMCNQLEGVTGQDVTCLESLLPGHCVEFFAWLKSNMKDGLKELNVFVDLALISAGEEPMTIGRVNCFHAVALSYAPLIFTEEIKSCDHLLKQCKLVSANVAADSDLPQKLEDTVRYLDWFKDVQKSHGSVEKTSLSQVVNINARGIFKLGRRDSKDMSLQTVIGLNVSEDAEVMCQGRRYNYDELLDLQSRLMLVVGQAEKGKENVERFITIMESLVRLGKTYVELCSDGCVLFLDWTVEFLCDVDRPLCCVSQFSSEGKLKGHRSEKEDLEKFIAGVASFLEQCHKEWLDYVDKKREEYPELNVYTMQQLVFLQQELVKVGSRDVNEHVYPVLSLLKWDCGPLDLEQALEEAMEQQLHEKYQRPEEAFLLELEQNGFSRPLVLRAMEEVGCNDVAQGIEWCMTRLEEEDQGEHETKEGLMGEDGGQQLVVKRSTIERLKNNKEREKGTSLQSLIDDLGSVWRQFLDALSASGMDFFSLEHLAIVLRCLAARDQREFNRSLPPDFKPRRPNLIICPKGEVLNAVTYMYMFPRDSILPQPEEVLLCTEGSTFEQVKIFLRRAFFGGQQKVYTLAFADNLDYDVGEKTEKKIKEYITLAGDNDYNLVVVCTSENEYCARIVAALEKYRCPPPSLCTNKLVADYLRTRFTGVVDKAGVESASVIDPETLSVRVVKSNRSGMGKTLYKQRLDSRLRDKLGKATYPLTIPLTGRVADTADIAARLLRHSLAAEEILPRIVHLDISYQVQEGVDRLLYNLLILGCVTDHQGYVWLRSPMDLYLVETMPLIDQKDGQRGGSLVHPLLEVLPSLNCWSPRDSLAILTEPTTFPEYTQHDSLFDEEEFASEMYQRPCGYLQEQRKKDATKADCLKTLLRYCGVTNPSWCELRHFVCFLNKQLQDFENSVFCGMATSADLPGFSKFVLLFLIQMSRDFATRSLNISEESLSALMEEDGENNYIQQYEMRRTWETSPHPYIFFNPDEHTMTFLGFFIDPVSFNLLDTGSGQVLEKSIIDQQLFEALTLNKVPLNENFDKLSRKDRLLRLYQVLGLFEEEILDVNGCIIDPDETYELTTDNVMKILAIYMRFRCNIPVIVMGETGCGKTRLVKFLCALQTPRQPEINTMVLVKVHGGTTGADIRDNVNKAEEMAQRNSEVIKHRPIYTVLFFDEANTTEAVGVIKEVMCDGTLNGQQNNLCPNLKMVAACNPYRKHSDELIQRLENAGLGYHVDTDKTVDKLGRVPMRRLVYRVQPLPQSMLPLVWDFGQLNTMVEELYIRQMVTRYVKNDKLEDLGVIGIDILCKILLESQKFMRNLKDECSFVSLRDVERTLTLTSWFYKQQLEKMGWQNRKKDEETEDIRDKEEDDDEGRLTVALVLALGVCYRACLRSKSEFDAAIIQFFEGSFQLPAEVDIFHHIIDRCQNAFLDNVRLEDNIARNQALKENFFMMVVCVELRIPLFLVGKPGSSKSLAKTIVSDAMQGNSSYSDHFKTLKQVQLVSFQCSPLSTAEGILGIFRQCAQFQKSKSMDKFVSVVVLDEVGLAEDSPKMPLKTLHPLLEDGYPGDEVPDTCRKVAFIGISNWALDPAKMNRGILVQRDVPDEKELVDTARDICKQNERALGDMKPLIPPLAKAYLHIFEEAKRKREFFGLRDFYSLVKMVYTFAAQSQRKPSQRQLIAAIRRNFGGLDSIDPVEHFKKELPTSLCDEQARPCDPDCTPSGLIKAALSGDGVEGDTRYLLLLTENCGGLTILSENLLADRLVVPIFGSSFPKDQEYTQICRNINRIKVCMETGQTAILLNLENLYESLYDALNQYYAVLGGERYVDLGLGTHRVKCRVHRKFRLMVVAEKQVVYANFPIPLINRLEKHFLTLNNIVSSPQLDMARKLDQWAEKYVTDVRQPQLYHVRQRKTTVGDVFMGYHSDTAPAIVLKVWDKLKVDETSPSDEQVLRECQCLLLWCATPDAVVRSPDTEWSHVYHTEQQHENLQQYLQQTLQQQQQQRTGIVMAQVTTHSKLLTEQEREELSQCLPVSSVTLLSLQAFDTEQQFCQQLRLFFTEPQEGQVGPKLLIVQCDSGDLNRKLIQCAQYCTRDLRPADSYLHDVVFIVQLPRVAGDCFTGFLGGNWHCLHIDDLRKTERPLPPITLLLSYTPAQLIMASTLAQQDSPMEADVGDAKVEGPHHEGFDPAYVRHLFASSIQAAVALVKDHEDSNVQRAMHRITILLCLIDENAEFFSGLQKLVGSILMQKEERAHEQKRWLSREASKPESVKKAGTFRRAWMQYVQNKVVPVLAAAVAYLDTNHNLDILYRAHASAHATQTPDRHSGQDAGRSSTLVGEAPEAAWMTRVWLGVLREVCQLNYRQLRSVSNKDELDEFTVGNTAACPLSAALPFSWLMWELVDYAICEAKNVQDDPQDAAGAVVEQSALGKCMQRAVGDCEETLQQIFHLYISDLLRFSFPLTSLQHERMRVCMENGLRQLNINLLKLGFGRGLVALHMLLEQMRSRLQSLLDIDGVRPAAIKALTNGHVDPCTELHNTENEMTDDVVLLRLLMEGLHPSDVSKQFSEERGCRQWADNYTIVAPVVLRLLSDSEATLLEGEEDEGDDEGRSEPQSLCYGDRCKQELKEIRCMWTRMTTVKLFFDTVVPLQQVHEKIRGAIRKVKIMLLWTRIGPETDFKNVRTLKKLDKFLLHANSFILKGLLGQLENCTYCDTKFDSAPAELPCKHKLCKGCYRDMQHGDGAVAKCPECRAPVPQTFDPTSECQNRESVELLGRYQRQMSGFMMKVVSQLCFAGAEPPQPEAVRHIFGYIMHRSKGKELLQTKQMTVYDDQVDPTPVLRSFLLRLLLKHSEKEMRGHLENFLRDARELVEQQSQVAASDASSGASAYQQLCLLIVYCREDMYHEQEAVASEASVSSDDRLLSLTASLHDVRTMLADGPQVLAVLYSLGLLRYALDACAHILYQTFVAEDVGAGAVQVSEELRNLMAAAQDIHQDSRSGWPQKFVIKQLCREYGLQAHITLSKVAKRVDCLGWLVFDESDDKMDEVCDRYLVCSQHYKTVRDAVATLRINNDIEGMQQIVKGLPVSKEEKEMMLMLAIHREVGMTTFKDIPPKARKKMVKTVKAVVESCDLLQDKALAHQLCDNSLGPEGSALHVAAGQDVGQQSWVCLLTHLRLALTPTQHTSALLHPLSELIFNPSAMKQSFLPTMPQDNLEDIMKGIQDSPFGRPTVWRCPNGHRYLVGDCGRPVEVANARCNVCAEKIGGKDYNKSAEGNVQVQPDDETQTGHILGTAAQRGLESLPERDLSTVDCALLRFLTHAALYLGASQPLQRTTIADMVQPKLEEGEDVCVFMMEHVRRDLEVLQRVLRRSADDVFLLLHYLCHHLTIFKCDIGQVALTEKQERSTWEKDVATHCLQTVVQDIDNVLKQGNADIVADQRQGDILNMVYETDAVAEAPGDPDIEHLGDMGAVWCYRPRITVDHFFSHFHLQVESQPDKNGKFSIIRLFKAERHIIQALHYVPTILAGQRQLMMRLHRRMDRAEALQLTIQEVVETKEYAGLEKLLNNFSKAWAIVKEHLIVYSCMAPLEGLVSLPEEFHNAIVNAQSPLAVVLPSTQGPGLCSYILLQFLLSRHNDLLQQYCPMAKLTYKSLPQVTARGITERHLVGCCMERAVLPLVLAHCNHTLQVGQAATLDYDFPAFEQQLVDTLMQCKARVFREPFGHIPVETMVYRADITSSKLFKILREKIPQVCLSPAERHQIIEDLRGSLPDVCQSIDNLNLALSFLRALGGKPTDSLHDFMTQSLRMKRTVYSQKAQQLCNLSHVQSLWIVLCYQRTSILASYDQPAFDSLDKELCEELTVEQEKELEAAYQHMSVERLELLVLQLFECIMLILAEPRDQEDDTRPENFKLQDVLVSNLESPLYDTERAELLTAEDMASFPQSLQGRHATATWTAFHAILTKKRQAAI